jgi:hypothetical protein
MRQDDGALALVRQDIPPIDSASNDDFNAAPLRPAGNTRNVSAVKKLAVAAKRMSAGAAHRRPVSTVVASGTDMATESTADIGSSSPLTAMSPIVGHSKLAVTASGQAENTIDDQHKVIITSRMAVGSSLSPPFSPPRQAKKLDRTESPGSRQARAQASRTSTHSSSTTKQCETCQQVSANYGVAADAFRKRWCGSCAKSHGAVNPGRARRAQVTGEHGSPDFVTVYLLTAISSDFVTVYLLTSKVFLKIILGFCPLGCVEINIRCQPFFPGGM